MVILITGGAGNIGSALANSLSKRCKVVVADDLSTGRIEKLDGAERLIFRNVNVNVFSEIEPLFKEFDFDYVFHFAAMVGERQSPHWVYF